MFEREKFPEIISARGSSHVQCMSLNLDHVSFFFCELKGNALHNIPSSHLSIPESKVFTNVVQFTEVHRAP